MPFTKIQIFVQALNNKKGLDPSKPLLVCRRCNSRTLLLLVGVAELRPAACGVFTSFPCFGFRRTPGFLCSCHVVSPFCRFLQFNNAIFVPLKTLEVFKNDPNGFDLVITDQTMPNMTGKDLARALMPIRPGIPIILCTGFSEQIDEKRLCYWAFDPSS